MTCPACHLENPPAAERCDCGYNFTLGTKPRARTRPSPIATIIIVSIVAVAAIMICDVMMTTRDQGRRAPSPAPQTKHIPIPDNVPARNADLPVPPTIYDSDGRIILKEDTPVQKKLTEEAYKKALGMRAGSSDRTKAESFASAAIPRDVTYTIKDHGTIPGIKRSLDIRLSRSVSKEVLRAIAIKFKNSDRRVYERTFFAYWLPGMKIGSGAWATTDFDPDLVVRVFGLTPDSEKAIVKAMDNNVSRATGNHSRLVIGRWLDETPFVLIRGISFYRENGILYMHREFEDGSSGRAELVTLGDKRFKEKERLELDDYYLIDRNGNLQLRDKEGLITTARKLQ